MLLRYFYLYIFLILGAADVFGQAVAVENRVYQNAKHLLVDRYQPDRSFEYLVLASDFSKETIKQIPFTDRRIVRIDLVYSTFSESAEFDQKELDLGRLKGLIALNPRIVDNQFFEWRIIGQTGCNSSASCKNFFHGFVIYYEDYFTKETSALEIDSIKTELRNLDRFIVKNQEKLKINYKRIACEYPESYYSNSNLTEKLEKYYQCYEDFKGRVFFEADLDYKGRPVDVLIKGSLFPCKSELAKRLKFILQWKRGLIIGHKQYGVKANGYVSFPLKKESVFLQGFEISDELKEEFQMLQQYSQCVAYEMDTSYAELIPKMNKRVVSEVLERNTWKPSLYVVDVTGSMYPFTSDLLKWIKLKNDSIPADYVFFNDGDDKPTNQKIIGQTGGIYHIRTDDFTEVKMKMFEAMRNGGGGDLPENNFEALMVGINQSKSSGEIIMIADNYSFPRDEAMLARFSGKLRILLCHTDKGINTDYLNLARKYGFTLHTTKSDVVNFNSSSLTVDGYSYKYSSGRYYLAR